MPPTKLMRSLVRGSSCRAAAEGSVSARRRPFRSRRRRIPCLPLAVRVSLGGLHFCMGVGGAPLARGHLFVRVLSSHPAASSHQVLDDTVVREDLRFVLAERDSSTCACFSPAHFEVRLAARVPRYSTVVTVGDLLGSTLANASTIADPWQSTCQIYVRARRPARSSYEQRLRFPPRRTTRINVLRRAIRSETLVQFLRPIAGISLLVR